MKKTIFLIEFIFLCICSFGQENNFPINGDAEIKTGILLLETNQWRNSLLTLKDLHYEPDQVYHFQIGSDGLKIKQDNSINYQFKSGGDFIVSNGKLGIGTNDPQKVLHSVGNYNMVQMRLERTGSYEGFCDLGGSNGDFRVWSGGYDSNHKFVVKGNSGDVGVNTISPETIFQIEGNGGEPINNYDELKERANFILSSNTSTSDGGLGTNTKLLAGIGSSSYVWLQAYNNSSTGAPKNIVINNAGGNVLIGKVTQQNSTYRLDVAGSIRANEIKVNSDGADFVFESDYTLRSLKEVESFIKENKHLPDIDPASEMQDNGVNIGEMNTQLLQKIEELTLYIIDLQKQVDDLKGQLDKQE